MPANVGRLWNDERMLQLARAIVGVASDVLRLVVLFLRSSSAIRAENLVLRKQLARYIERGIKLFPGRCPFGFLKGNNESVQFWNSTNSNL